MSINKFLQQQIIQMKDVEQKARLSCKMGGKLTIKNYMIYLADVANGHSLGKIAERGYPTYELIGKKGMEALCLMLVHQVHYNIALVKSFLKNCDFTKPQKAWITDAIEWASNKKQIYGTLFNVEIRDKKNVDKRRKEMELEPLDKFLKKQERLMKK